MTASAAPPEADSLSRLGHEICPNCHPPWAYPLSVVSYSHAEPSPCCLYIAHLIHLVRNGLSSTTLARHLWRRDQGIKPGRQTQPFPLSNCPFSAPADPHRK